MKKVLEDLENGEFVRTQVSNRENEKDDQVKLNSINKMTQGKV